MAYKNNSDMEHENIGWEQMHTILNKEMPVIKKRRGIAYIWWVGGAVAACVLVVILFSPNDNSSDAQEKSIAGVSLEDQTNLTIDSNEVTAPTSTAIFNTPQITKTIETENKTTAISKTKKQVGSNTVADSNNKLLAQTALPIKDKFISEVKKVHNSKVIQTPPTAPFALATTERQSIIIPSILESNLAYHLSSDKKKSINAQIHLAGRLKIRWGINLSSNYSPNQNYNELGVGILGIVNIHRRWELSAGIDYHLRNNLFTSKSLAEFAAADQTFGSQAPLVQSGALIDRANSEITLSQLSLPLGIQYKLSPQWNLGTSITPSYTLINLNEFNTWYANAYQNGTADIVFTDPQRWNIHIGLDLHYYLSNNLALGLNYSILASDKASTLISPNFESNEWKFSIRYLLD